MPGESLQSVVQYLHRIIDVGPGAASDADLLERFANNRDENAFALLVCRHGPMILGVCQRVLRHEHDSEDVFQATFLTLARRANSISKKDSLASWLHKVAFRIACRARGKVPMLTNQAVLQAEAEPDADVIWRDLRPVLDQEIAQLPASQSRPIVLCYLEGKTHEEAAQLLGWPKGTLAARLARGRERLRQRLTRRGWTLSAAVLSTVLADKAGATAISAELMRSTVQAALAYVSGTSVAVLSAKAVALAEGVMQMMWYSKVKMAVVMLLAVALTGSGVGWAMFAGGAGPEQAAQKPKAEPAGDAKAEMAAMRAEIARLRTELDAAMKEVKSLKEGRTGKPELQELRYKGKTVSGWLEILADIDPDTRRKAIEPLATFAEKRKDLIPTLLATLKDEDSGIRSEVIRFIAPFAAKDQTIIAALIAALEDPDENVGRFTSHFLGRAGPSVVPHLVRVINDKASKVQTISLAINSLGLLGSDAKASVPLLTKMLKEDLSRPAVKGPSFRRELIHALWGIGPDAITAMPVLVDAFERSLNAPAVKAIHDRQITDLDEALAVFGDGSPLGRLANAISAIDPKLAEAFPAVTQFDPKKAFAKGGAGIAGNEIVGAWRSAFDRVKKKYPQAP